LTAGLSSLLASVAIANTTAATTAIPGEAGTSSLPATSSGTDASAGDQPVTYSSTRFAVPFEVTLPVWVAPESVTEEPNFVTWEGSEVDRAIRFLAPVNVYPPEAMTTGTPSPLPDDYLSYFLAQAEHGAIFDDVVETTIDGIPGTVVTATTDGNLDGSLGCQAEGLAANDCFGLQPDLTLRLAVVEVGNQPLLIWVRDFRGDEGEYDTFGEMLASVRFLETSNTSAQPATTTSRDVGVTVASAPQTSTDLVGGRIAFSRLLPDGGTQPYTVNPDGSDEQLVDVSALNEDWGRAVWSHDGQQLLLSNVLFDQDGEFLGFRPATARPDGSEFNLLELSEFPFDMNCSAWSPDDRRILCAVGGESQGMWSMAAADGGDPVQLTTNPDGLNDQAIGYSPDGTEIAFLRFRPDGAVALFLVNADGTEPRQVTEFGELLGHEPASAAWSPDGEHLISATPSGDLVEVRADGSGAETIDLDLDTDDYFAFAPNYSPDGSRIVFSLEVAAAADIYTADGDGSNVTQLTDTDGPERFPSWTDTMP
jgi:Tol biopolymer transport system component